MVGGTCVQSGTDALYDPRDLFKNCGATSGEAFRLRSAAATEWTRASMATSDGATSDEYLTAFYRAAPWRPRCGWWSGAAGSGGITQQTLPVMRPLPQVDFPTLSFCEPARVRVLKPWPPRLATPLERQFGRIAGVTEMTSSSTLGETGSVLQFEFVDAT